MKIYKLNGAWPTIPGNPTNGEFTSKEVAEKWAKKLNCTVTEIEMPYDSNYLIFNTDNILL